MWGTAALVVLEGTHQQPAPPTLCGWAFSGSTGGQLCAICCARAAYSWHPQNFCVCLHGAETAACWPWTLQVPPFSHSLAGITVQRMMQLLPWVRDVPFIFIARCCCGDELLEKAQPGQQPSMLCLHT